MYTKRISHPWIFFCAFVQVKSGRSTAAVAANEVKLTLVIFKLIYYPSRPWVWASTNDRKLLKPETLTRIELLLLSLCFISIIDTRRNITLVFFRSDVRSAVILQFDHILTSSINSWFQWRNYGKSLLVRSLMLFYFVASLIQISNSITS